ncbi:MAG: hypothetical protein IJW23_10925 [Lentisphaeria bacterium]|nr:hypothetical protein [Lentisphaeria bacterium]
MNDAEKLVSIPEEIIFEAYWQRMMDRLRIVYDPEYSSAEEIYGVTIVSVAYSGCWSYLPDIVKNGGNVLELAERHFPKNGMVKDLGYFPFLAWFSVASRQNHTIPDFIFPESGTPVSPENIGVASERFPAIHGVESYMLFTTWFTPENNFYDPVNLAGSPVRTYAKYQMAKALDRILDRSFAILHPEETFLLLDVPDFYKRSDIYCTFDMKVTAENGATLRETTSTVFLQKTYGEFGWFDVGGALSARRTDLRVSIHSESPLRYKYLVLCMTDSNKADYGTCRYDFFRSGRVLSARCSVIYESPDWCTGDTVWEYQFSEGEQPEDGKPDYVRLQSPAVIIYPEYPDRLKELYETKIERS